VSQSDDAEAEDFGVFYNPETDRFEPLACPFELALKALELLPAPEEKAPCAQSRQKRSNKTRPSKKIRARIALANRLNFEREHGPISGCADDYLSRYIEDPEQADEWLCSAILGLAIRTYDQDFVRLAYLNAAYSGRWVASDYGENLPDKPGMASAYAISTIMACGWTKNQDGTWRSDKRLTQQGFDHDPVDAGKTWRKRLAKRLRDREENVADFTNYRIAESVSS
jgi:hypothetical protein